jgi:predicted tellurium resistance membrane protein TerC
MAGDADKEAEMYADQVVGPLTYSEPVKIGCYVLLLLFAFTMAVEVAGVHLPPIVEYIAVGFVVAIPVGRYLMDQQHNRRWHKAYIEKWRESSSE